MSSAATRGAVIPLRRSGARHRIVNLATGDSFEVEEGQAVLDGATDAEVDLPHGCRVGVCGACAVEVTEGAENAEEPDPIEADTLDRCEIQHCRLACRLTTRGPVSVRPLD